MKQLLGSMLLVASAFTYASPLSNYEQAFEQLNTMIEQQNELPTFKTKQGTQIINQLTDLQVIKFFDNKPFDELDSLFEVCAASGLMVPIYILYGIDENASPLAIQKASQENSKLFEKEIIAHFIFTTHCTNKTIAEMIRYSQEQDNRDAEGREILQQYTAFYGELFSIINDKHIYSELSKLKINDMLIEITPNFVQIMSKTMRQEFIEFIDSTQSERSAQLNNKMDEVVKRIKNAPCEFLCLQ